MQKARKHYFIEPIKLNENEIEEEPLITIPQVSLLNKMLDPNSSPQEFFVPIRFSAQQHLKDQDGFFIPLPRNNYTQTQTIQQFQNEQEPLQLKDLVYLEELGLGSSGRVQKAIHQPSQIYVALKTIQLVNDQKFTHQVNLELQTLVSCNHPNIIKCYGAFLQNLQVTVALEYMNWGTLQDVISRKQGIPEIMLGFIAYQLLRGLDYLHKVKKIIHRDIKPSNLLINSNGEVKISDFGVSGQLLNTKDQLTTWIGTITYMSPERFLCEPYSSNTDIWSLGLSLLECAWGIFPYPHPGSTESKQLGFWEMKEYILTKEVPPTPDHFSENARSFISNCLQKDPQKRWTASQLLEHQFVTDYKDVSLTYLAKWLESQLK